MLPEETLLIMARRPQAGAVKTRLSPPLSPQQAAELYAACLADTLALAESFPAVGRVIAVHPPEAQAEFARLAPDWVRLAQHGAGLGERMRHALAAVFAAGAQRVALIGSDTPHLPAGALAAAFAALREGADMALGPAEDGGYYLIGLRQPHPELFEIEMGTPQVGAQTRARAAQQGLRVAQLPVNFDLDTAADLERLRARLAADPSLPACRTRAWLARYTAG
jgi:rSAM/selenodomain-associated transferase 1